MDDAERRKALSVRVPTEDVLPASTTVKVDIGVRSHQGTVRSTNEDHYLIVELGRQQQTLATSLPEADLPKRFEERGYAMLVADGIGSGGAGSVASRVALSTIAQLSLQHGKWNLRIDPSVSSEILRRAVWLHSQADAAVTDLRNSTLALGDMATALTAAYTVGDHLFLAHVGHSRAYLMRGGNLQQLTRDQTAARYTAATGRPVAVERRGQDLDHILTDAIGSSGGEPVVQIDHLRLVDGDALLLCTNGLTDMVDDERLADLLCMRRDSAEQCRLLVDAANQAGGRDNITAIVAQYAVPPARVATPEIL